MFDQTFYIVKWLYRLNNIHDCGEGRISPITDLRGIGGGDKTEVK